MNTDQPVPDVLPPVRLDPILWAPQFVPAKLRRRELDAGYDAYRTANRPFRRAFVGGERRRRILQQAGLAMAAERIRAGLR